MEIAAVAVVGALMLGLVAALRAVVVREPDPVIKKLIVLGLLAKLGGSVARYTFMAELYGGRADYRRYFRAGTDLAGQIRSGSLPEQAKQTGTQFLEFVSGVVYAVVPNELWAGFFVFSLLSFIGAFLFLQAFRLALPDGNHRLYAVLVFFAPTMVFWPSSIGKEAWLVFTLGLSAYGAARILTRARLGYLIAGAGVAGAFAVRPHMAALLALSIAGAYAIRFRDPAVRPGLAVWALGLVLIVGGAAYTLANFADELPRDESVEGSATDQIFAETERRTSIGGSEFDSRPVRSPGDFVHAAITVPFRPFPTEGHNRQAQLAGLEGLLLFLLLLASLPRLRSLPRMLLRRPYVAMATAYSVGFIIAFSNVGNFGILTRQRAQLLPFLFVLLALPAARAVRERGLRPRQPVLVTTTLEAQGAAGSAGAPRGEDGSARREPDPIATQAEATELIVDLPRGTLRSEGPGAG
jgi:hypothetical protein